MFGKKNFVEFEHTLEGRDAVVLEQMLHDFDVRYEKATPGYTYFRLKANNGDVKKISKLLEKLGYVGVLVDNRIFNVYERV